jgi:hypothetical protein
VVDRHGRRLAAKIVADSGDESAFPKKLGSGVGEFDFETGQCGAKTQSSALVDKTERQ